MMNFDNTDSHHSCFTNFKCRMKRHGSTSVLENFSMTQTVVSTFSLHSSLAV